MQRTVALVLLSLAVAASAQDDAVQKWVEETSPYQEKPARLAAIEELRRLGDRAFPAAKRIAWLVADEDADIAAAAEGIVRAFGAKALPALVDAGEHEGPGADRLADLIVEFGRADPPAVARAVGELRYVRPDSASVMALARLGAPVVPELVRLLETTNPDQGKTAVICLRRLGAQAREALPELRRVYAERRFLFDQQKVAAAIASVTPDEEERRRVLFEAFDAGHSPDEALLSEIARLGPEAKRIVPSLLEKIHAVEGTTSLCVPALRGLWLIEGDASRVLPPLVRMLTAMPPPSNRPGAIRWSAYDLEACTKLLAEMGEAARPAGGALLEAMARSRWPDPALPAALERIGVDAALLPRILEWLWEENTAETALHALALVDRIPEALLPDVCAVLSVDDERYRYAASHALRRAGIADPAVAGALAVSLAHADEKFSCALLEQLALLGPDAAPAVPSVRKAFRDPGGSARAAAMEVCARIGAAAAAALPEALEAVAAREDDVAEAGARALEAFGPGVAESAVPKLREALKGPPSRRGLAMARALVALCGDPVAEDLVRYVAGCLVTPELQAETFAVLVRAGSAAHPCVPLAKEVLLGEADPLARVGAAHLLLLAGSETNLAMETLSGVLRSGHSRAILAACSVVEEVGARAASLREVLARLRSDLPLGEEEDAAIQRALAALGPP